MRRLNIRCFTTLRNTVVCWRSTCTVAGMCTVAQFCKRAILLPRQVFSSFALFMAALKNVVKETLLTRAR